MKDSVQICATIPTSLRDEIVEMSERDARTFSQQVSLLLQRAVRDSKRKKKNGQKDGTEYHPANAR